MSKQLFDWISPLHRPETARMPVHAWRVTAGRAQALAVEMEGVGAHESIPIEQLPSILSNRLEQAFRLKMLEARVAELEARVEQLEEPSSDAPVTFHIETFAPEPYKVRRPIPIVTRPDGEGYIASFADANINSSGDTRQEAYANVKELLLDMLESLGSLPPEQLGPRPARQLAVLRDFIDAAHHERARRKDRE